MNLKPSRVSIKFGRAAAVAKQLLREEKAIRQAARLMPRPVPWEWAKPRIVPLLAGPYMDRAGEPLVRAVAAPGCTLVFGLEVGQAYPLVDDVVAQRWECTAEQIHDVGMANLRRRAAALESRSVQTGTLSGWIIAQTRALGWGSSLVLVPDQLMRLFGPQDQMLLTPSRASLVSFPMATPTHVVVDIALEMESGEAFPLMLDPFVLEAGVVVWNGALEEDELMSGE